MVSLVVSMKLPHSSSLTYAHTDFIKGQLWINAYYRIRGNVNCTATTVADEDVFTRLCSSQ